MIDILLTLLDAPRELVGCLLHHPIRTLEQPFVFVTPIDRWFW
ncbi:hypothetical protein [Nocardia abscessus]|nr:hypothetical protein [Nocardia abscessus]